MKNIKSILILLFFMSSAYAVGPETKAKIEATREEHSKADAALVNAIRKKDLVGVEDALKHGAHIMTPMQTPYRTNDSQGPAVLPVLNYIIWEKVNEPFRHAVFNLFFKYNTLNSHNLNMPMECGFFPDDERVVLSPFQVCVVSEAPDLVQKSIERGGDVNKIVDKSHPMTPLIMLAHGTGGVDSPEDREESAAVTARRERNRQEVAELLIKHGALTDVEDSNGYDSNATALDYAIIYNYISLAKVLLSHKAKFHPVEALHSAILDHNFALVDLLLNYGVDPNATCEKKTWDYYNFECGSATPLIRACERSWPTGKIDIDIIQRLLAAGANPLLEDNDGHDAAWYLVHLRKEKSNKSIYIPETIPSPERLQALKLLNDVIAKKLKEVEHTIFSIPGIPEFTGEFISGHMPKNPEFTQEPDEE